jgi:alpha-D-ribose 1-methylphosphonate 5-triphosphate synthase subunit PhnH
MSIELPGFADPVLDAQAGFRAVLAAMSRPGFVQSAGSGLTAPAPLAPSTAAVLLTLVDAETALAIDPDFAPAQEWIDFHCGPLPATPATAAFVLAAALPDLATLATGSDEMPEASATVILQVASLGSGRRYSLAGPGLRMPQLLLVDGLPDDFAARWAVNHTLYPRGVDLILCAGDRLVALPRSVTVGEG